MRRVASYQKSFWARSQKGRRSTSHPVVRSLFEPRARFIAGLVDDSRRCSVLDVGCGNGFLTSPLESLFHRAVGVDLSPAMIEVNPCQEAVVASATELPFETGEFDLVVESHLLHHLDAGQRWQAVTEMARVARRAVVLYEPNRNNLLMFAFGVIRRSERMSLAFSGRYLRRLLGRISDEVEVRAEGLTTPNLCPEAWIPVARRLESSPVRRYGFYLRAVAWLRESGTA